MQFLLIFGWFSFVLSFTNAAAAAVPDCKANSLNSLTIRASAPLNGPGIDLCLPSVISEEAWASRLVSELGARNHRAAELFKIPPAELFPQGIPVNIYRDPLGPIASFASDTGMAMGVFADWEGAPLNEGIYVHELGHYITWQSHAALPRGFRLLNHSALFQETFADLIALHLVGRIFVADDSLPSCLSNLRKIMDFQSYSYPVGYFDIHFGMRRFSACCAYMKEKGKLTGNVTDVCSNVERALETSPLPPMDRSRLNVPEVTAVETLEPSGAMLDPHQFGIPINSFFHEFRKASGLPTPELVIQALRDFEKTGAFHRYTCSLRKNGVPAMETAIQVPSFAKMLRSIANQLKPEDRLRFDTLWTKHGIDRGLVVYENETAELALRQFLELQFEQPEKLPEAWARCLDSFSGATFTDSSCTMRCERVN